MKKQYSKLSHKKEILKFLFFSCSTRRLMSVSLEIKLNTFAFAENFLSTIVVCRDRSTKSIQNSTFLYFSVLFYVLRSFSILLLHDKQVFVVVCNRACVVCLFSLFSFMESTEKNLHYFRVFKKAHSSKYSRAD